MSIFTPVLKTKIEVKKEAIIESSSKIIAGEKNRVKAVFDLMWNDLSRSEAQELMDSFGNEAYKIFQFHAAWQQLIKGVDDSYDPLYPPYEYTISEDGTVTISQNE